MAVVAETELARQSARLAPLMLAIVSVALLVAAAALAFSPVRVAEGDTSPYRCTPLTAGTSDATLDCREHVHGRLVASTLAGVGAGIVGLLAFGTELVIQRSLEQLND